MAAISTLLVMLASLACVMGMTLPHTQISTTHGQLMKRAVTYGSTTNAGSASAICSDEQRKYLEARMPETATLAQAGSDGLAIIINALQDDKSQRTTFKALPPADQSRLRQTYITFFGDPEKQIKAKTASLADLRARLQKLKDILDRVKGLTVATWPNKITIFCDSTIFQDKDPNGKKADDIKELKPPTNPEKLWKYDYNENKWAEIYKKQDCSAQGSTVAGHTDRLQNDDGSWKSDRIIFCPEWFKVSQGLDDYGNQIKQFADTDPQKDIQADKTTLKDFRRKGARLFFHEHLHTYTLRQSLDGKGIMRDVGGDNGYGPYNSQRIATDDPVKAAQNIESLVYWCIAMQYGMYDWSSLTALASGIAKTDGTQH